MGNPILTKQGLGNFKAILDYQVAQMAKHDPDKVKAESIASLRCFVDNFLGHHFTIEFCDFHTEMIDTLNDEKANKRIVRIAPRGHGKTTLCSFAFPLWCLATKRKRSVLIIGSNQDLANQKLNDLINELETNTYLLSMFPHLKPAKDNKNQFVKYTDSHIVFDNLSDILAKGMGAAVRGIKPRRDLVIIDDPEKDSDLDSPTTRQKNKAYFDNVVRFLGGPGQSMDILAIDTLKHYDSLIQYIMEKPGWDAKKYSAVVDEPTKQVLWPDVYCFDVDCLTEDEKTNWNKRGQKGWEKIHEPFYGTYFEDDKPKIIGIATDRPESFAQEFLSQPVQLSSMPLRAELWRTFPFSDDLPGKFPYRIGTMDLSMGKKDSDFQCIAIVGATMDNYYLLDAAMVRVDLVGSEENEASLAGLCVAFIERYNLKLFVLEDNGSQGLFINAIKRSLQKNKINCRIKGLFSSGDKTERISLGLGLVMQRGSFHIREDWQQVYPDFMRQFEHFPKGDHDDAPDVTNMALIGIQRMRG